MGDSSYEEDPPRYSYARSASQAPMMTA